MQALLHLHPHFVNSLITNYSTNGSTPLIQLVFKHYNYFNEKSSKRNTSDLKALVGYTFNNHLHDQYQLNQQEDCFLFLIDFLTISPIETRQLFTFSTILDVTCINCNSHGAFCDNNLTHISIQLDPNNNYTDFQKALSQDSVRERKCSICQNKNSLHREKMNDIT